MVTTGITIDPDALIVALESHEAETEWVLDLRTGEVIPVINPAITGDFTVQGELERDPERYLHIEPIPSREGFGIMGSFVADIPPGPARNRLLAALDGRHPFREFKSVLLAFPALRAQWFRYHDERMRSLAEVWLSDHELNAALGPGLTSNRGV
jgi:Uncharacterised protein family (UPF0158)